MPVLTTSRSSAPAHQPSPQFGIAPSAGAALGILAPPSVGAGITRLDTRPLARAINLEATKSLNTRAGELIAGVISAIATSAHVMRESVLQFARSISPW